jgi:class 3 adenylate cyclase/ligand-binding sensor domain-containing protein
MKKTLAILLLVVCMTTQNITAQNGYFYVSDYELNESFADSKVTDMAFDAAGTLFLAGRKGVSAFDGINWYRIKNISPNAFVLHPDSAGEKIYVGLKNEFGYIARNSKGEFEYKTIHSTPDKNYEFSKILITKNRISFYSDHAVFFVNPQENFIAEQLPNPDNKVFRGILKRRDNLYINVKGTGVCRIKDNELEAMSSGRKFKDSRILFHTSCNNVYELIGTDNNSLYLFGSDGFMLFSKNTDIRNFLKENILWDAADYTDKHFAVSTLTGGCVIIDKKYGKIKHSINYMTGLPDDEIYAFALAPDNSLWFAHQYGLSSLNQQLNIRDYSPYRGIYGNLNDVIKIDNKLYIAANNGVYLLTEIPNKAEKEIIVKEKARYGYKFVPKKTYITISVDHRFIQVEGLKDKCKQFFKLKDKLLAVSDFGLYEITDSIAKPLVTDIYINDLLAETDTTVLYAASLKGLQSISFNYDSVKNKIVWKKNLLFDELNFPIYSVARDNSGNLIFGAESKAFFALKDSVLKFEKPFEIKFPKQPNEPVNVIKLNNIIHFVQSSGMYTYSSSSNTAELQQENSFLYGGFRWIEADDNIWIYKGREIFSADETLNFPNKKLFNLFTKIRNIYLDEEQNVWLINGRDRLIQILADSTATDSSAFAVHIVSFQDKRDSSYVLEHPEIAYKRNAVRIGLSAPFRLKSEATLYRYKVMGLENYDEWSVWSKNPFIELSYLPAGEYTVVVTAMNILGEISPETSVSFTVLTPFTQTNEFYILISVAGLLLIIILIWLSRLRLKMKNRALEKKVRERTIELQEEKDKTEALLLNILPKQTAEELKLHNKVTPRNYDITTVLFTDFKGFTMIAEKMSPEDLVHEIDFCFREFDKIIGNYRIEKIKTIGDAYMCAGGIPEEDAENAEQVVQAALDIRDFMVAYKKQRQESGEPFFEIRIGCHTGKVVAGVVGIKKYAYDIWGDTVNLASRMESSGEISKVNISGYTYELIKDNFNCTYRGKVQAKNKGEVDMYFVDGRKEKPRSE